MNVWNSRYFWMFVKYLLLTLLYESGKQIVLKQFPFLSQLKVNKTKNILTFWLMFPGKTLQIPVFSRLEVRTKVWFFLFEIGTHIQNFAFGQSAHAVLLLPTKLPNSFQHLSKFWQFWRLQSGIVHTSNVLWSYLYCTNVYSGFTFFVVTIS